MASTLAVGVVASAVLARLQADAVLTAFVPAARITDEIPPRPIYPCVLVEAGDEQPFNTMGAFPDAAKYGSTARVTVRALSQHPGDQEVCAILSAAKAAIDGQRLMPIGYPSAILTFASGALLKDTINGIVTREWIAEFETTVHQT